MATKTEKTVTTVDTDARDLRRVPSPQEEIVRVREETRLEEVQRLNDLPIPIPALSSFRGKALPDGEFYAVYLNGEQVVDVDEASASGGFEEGNGWVKRVVGDKVLKTEGVVTIVHWVGKKVDNAISPSLTEKRAREDKKEAERGTKRREARDQATMG